MKTFQITAYADKNRGLRMQKSLIEAEDIHFAKTFAKSMYPEYAEVGVLQIGETVETENEK